LAVIRIKDKTTIRAAKPANVHPPVRHVRRRADANIQPGAMTTTSFYGCSARLSMAQANCREILHFHAVFLDI